MDSRNTLEYVKQLNKLSRIARGIGRSLDTTQLEQDFLEFSGYTEKKALRVRIPAMYKLDGDEHKHFFDAMKALGQDDKAPELVDLAGAYDMRKPDNFMILLSTTQILADHLSTSNSYLNPLIERVYTEGARMIADFSIHEAIFGKVKCKRGNVLLEEILLFPDKFSTGRYTLEVKLDTPEKIIEKFSELSSMLEEFGKNAKENVLDEKKTKTITEKASGLRSKLGSLLRYEVPPTQSFSVETDTCVLRDGQTTLFYLYQPSVHRNILVYFGESPFENAEKPRNLILLDGEQQKETLAKLIELGFFEPSSPVVEERIFSLRSLYEDATRGIGRNLDREHADFNELLKELERIKTDISQFNDSRVKRQYATKLEPELLEMVVYPTSSNPTIHELLARLSWNKSIRLYHNTSKFITEFEQANDKRKKELLNSIVSNIHFNNQHNNNVNLWLMQNYAQFCQDNEIGFEVLNPKA